MSPEHHSGSPQKEEWGEFFTIYLNRVNYDFRGKFYDFKGELALFKGEIAIFKGKAIFRENLRF